MRITYLGTGAAGGVPRYGCNCAACERAENNRVFVRRPC
ncbi:MAG: phosphonate metabolism protein PhnP, partial [Sutterellaceae bacterium]|nr:phosphonate metabolism protein PhnP [Sutterellaceae bacterium]